jgi:large subunit ribosomal protein L24
MVGKDKGKQGKIIKCFHNKNSVVVEGCNLVKKHVKGTPEQPGGIATKESPLDLSNVSLVDPMNK